MPKDARIIETPDGLRAVGPFGELMVACAEVPGESEEQFGRRLGAAVLEALNAVSRPMPSKDPELNAMMGIRSTSTGSLVTISSGQAYFRAPNEAEMEVLKRRARGERR